jgi:hypothetical protein
MRRFAAMRKELPASSAFSRDDAVPSWVLPPVRRRPGALAAGASFFKLSAVARGPLGKRVCRRLPFKPTRD